MSWKDRAKKLEQGQTGSWKDRASNKGPLTSGLNNLRGEKEEPLQEMHPDISYTDRALIKNFSQSPSTGVDYLKKKYPEMNIAYDKERGQYLIKRPEETDYRVLDPDKEGFDGWGELAKDVGDIGYDVASGLGEGAATALGAAGGFFSPVPGGTLLGAVGASGASAATSEAIRQKLGQALGLDQDVSGTDVAITGAVGAASPLVLGADKMGGKQFAKMAAKKGMSKLAASEAFDKASRGGLKRGYEVVADKALPFAQELASGVDRNLINRLKQRLPEVDRLKETNAGKLVETARDEWVDVFNNARRGVGDKIGKALDSINTKVNIAPAKQEFKKEMEKLRRVAMKSKRPADIAKYYESLDVWYRYFATTPQKRQHVRQVSYDIPASFSRDVEKGLSKFEGMADDGLESFSPTAMTKRGTTDLVPEEKAISGVRPDSYQSPKDTAGNVIDDIEMTMDSPAREGFTDKTLKYRTRRLPDNVDADVAISMKEDLSHLAREGSVPGGIKTRFGKNDSIASKRIKNSLQGSNIQIKKALEKAMDESEGAITGDEYKKLKQAYKYFMDTQDTYGNKMKDDESFSRFIQGLTNSRNFTQMKKMQEADMILGTNLANQAELMELDRVFNNASLLPISSKGTTSTSRSIPLAMGLGLVGGYAGHQGGLTGQPGVDSGVGALSGAALGSMLASPRALKWYIRNQLRAEKLGRNLVRPGKAIPVPLRVPMGTDLGTSIWESMSEEEEQ